jgi:sugar phosphate isomerase/epimerase
MERQGLGGEFARMDRLSVNEMTTYRWSFDEDVAHYRQAGIAAIGVWRQKLEDYGETKGIKLLRQSGLHVSNVLWAGGFTGSDGHTFEESLLDAAEAIRLTAALGSDCLVVYSGGRNGHTLNHAHRLFKQALKKLLPAAEENGVRLAVEPMHLGCAAEWTFLVTLDDALEVLEEFNHPALKLAFDTYHLGHEPAVLDQISQVCPHIAIVHLGDSKCPPGGEQNRQRLGEGVLPLATIVSALRDGGYQGYFDVELMGEEIESSSYHQLLAGSRAAFDRLFAT